MKKSNSISIGGIKIVIGQSCLDEVANELHGKNCHKPLVVTDKSIESLGLLDLALKSLKENEVPYVVFDEVPSDPPSAVVRKGIAVFKENQCDSVIAMGGGSVMDTAKAINIMSTNDGDILEYDNSPKGGKKFAHDGSPLFSIPTTSGTGSEVTQYAVITDEAEHRKATIGDERLTSKVVFLTPVVTLGLPKGVTASTGIDALAHGIEAYTSNRVLNAAGSSVFSDTLAIKGIEYVGRNLLKAYANGGNMEARKNVMLGSTLAGLITQAGSGSAHGMGTPLGANFHVPHGTSVGIMLPYVMEYNIPACPERYRDIAAALGEKVDGLSVMEAAQKAPEAVKRMLRLMSFPTLQDYVKDKKDLDMLAAQAMKDKCCQLNARSMNEQTARELYEKAWNQE